MQMHHLNRAIFPYLLLLHFIIVTITLRLQTFDGVVVVVCYLCCYHLIQIYFVFCVVVLCHTFHFIVVRYTNYYSHHLWQRQCALRDLYHHFHFLISVVMVFFYHLNEFHTKWRRNKAENSIWLNRLHWSFSCCHILLKSPSSSFSVANVNIRDR